MDKNKTPDRVIWITTDHMRYDCIAAQGNPLMHTPNLDKLAGNGICFDRCYCQNPLCMPSRCSFMTGLYPQQTQVMCNGQELRSDFPATAAHCFSNGGYHTIQVGKLHFQGHQDEDMDTKAKDRFGFDVFNLSEEPGCYDDAYIKWLRNEHPEYASLFSLPRPTSPNRAQERTDFQVLDAPWECSHSGWVVEQAIRLLGGSFERKQFMHLGFYAPHPPLNPTREMFEPYKNIDLPLLIQKDYIPPKNQLTIEQLREYKRHFYAMVTGVDMAVGKLIDELISRGEFDNTLIIFSSDHGDACGDHGRILKDTSYYEGIVHLPLVFHWPAMFGNKARRIAEMVEMVDLLPTLLQLCNLPVMPNMQGNSYAQQLLEGSPIVGREDVYAVHQDGEYMLRNKHYKYLCYCNNHDRSGSVREVLYDLENDPDEFVNVAADAKYEEQLAKLRFRLLQRTSEASDSPQYKRIRF